MAFTLSQVALFINILLLRNVNAVQLFPSPGSMPTRVPAACRSALSTNITCNALVPANFVAAQRPLMNTTLKDICTTSCSQSLLSFQQAVKSACGDAPYEFYALSNSTVSSTADKLVSPLVWAHNVTCLQEGSSFCYAKVTSGSVTACSSCLLSYEAAMLGSVYGRGRIDPAGFSSQLSSCGVPASEYLYTSPTDGLTATSTSTTSTGATPTCTGKTYTVLSGDTCKTIADANSIATDRFTTENNIDYNCTTLIPGSEVCLTQPCALVIVQSNQTCNDILSNQTFYLTQLLSWNPTIHTNCDNLGSMVGRSICVSPPGSTKWDAAPSPTATSSNFAFVVASTNFGMIPAQSAVPNYTTSYFVNTVLPNITTTAMTANATAESQLAQRTGYCPFNASDYAAGLTIYDLPGNCSDLLEPYCFPDPDAPIPTATTFPASCAPAAVLSTTHITSGGSAATSTFGSTTTSTTASSISSVAPRQTGITSNCNRYYTVQPGDSCQGIIDKYNKEFTLSDFYSWNPAIGSDCSSLWVDYSVCVGIPSTPTSSPVTSSIAPSSTSSSTPMQTGIVSNCNRYYTVQSGDSCQSIVDKYRGEFTLSDFYSWNPVVGSGCSSLWVGYAVCVGIPGTPTTPPSSSSIASASTGPSPQEPRTNPNCKQYYKVVSGDSCFSIEQKFSITADQFNAWNPNVGKNCGSLWLGYYICVRA